LGLVLPGSSGSLAVGPGSGAWAAHLGLVLASIPSTRPGMPPQEQPSRLTRSRPGARGGGQSTPPGVGGLLVDGEGLGLGLEGLDPGDCGIERGSLFGEGLLGSSLGGGGVLQSLLDGSELGRHRLEGSTGISEDLLGGGLLLVRAIKAVEG